jgi:hypothetical protein
MIEIFDLLRSHSYRKGAKIFRFKKTPGIIIGAIILIVVIIIIITSLMTKHFIEKNDVKFSGRQIKTDWAYVNPFTGFVHLSNLKIYAKTIVDTINIIKPTGEGIDSVFFSADGVSINFAMLKLFSKRYVISKITLNHPQGILNQNEKGFNFTDMIEKFSSKDSSNIAKKPVRFSILNTQIIDGEFQYHENQIPINYSIKNVNITSRRKHWDSDTLSAKFSFSQSVGGGDLKGDITLNLKNKNYRIAIVANKFDLDIVAQYFNDLTNYGSFSATLDANIKSVGNINSVDSVTTSGTLAIHDFHLGKNREEDFIAFDQLVLSIDEISPKNHKFFYDSISLNNLYFKYEKYDYLDNLQTMFGRNGANIKAAKAEGARFNLVIEIMNYLKEMGKSLLVSHYKINRFAVYNGEIKFNDYSASEKFSMEFSPLNIIADSIDKQHDRVEVAFESTIKPYGNVTVAISLNPKDSTDFDIQYHLKKLPVSMFNPYAITYTSFPLNRGTIDLSGSWNVRNKQIQSNNHLLIANPRVAKRLRNDEIKWVPVPLILAFVNEKGNVIDYEIPVTGNLNDPNFHLNDVISDFLENIFIKPTKAPYRKVVKNENAEIEKSLTLIWEMRSSSLAPDQDRFLKKLANFMSDNPTASIEVYPQHYTIKEKEYMLYFEAKKKYFLTTNKKSAQFFSNDDSVKVDQMSVKDSLFVQYLNNQTNDPLIFTIQEKCARYIDTVIIDAKIEQLNKVREKVFLAWFKEKGADSRVKIFAGENIIPYNGFSFYKIEYKGEFPESLSKLYQQMN